MKKNPLIGKGLAIAVIFLFVGVAFAPSINFNVVKASNDNDLVEVTTQACGIKGFGNHTVKLTRQQYQSLEQYLVDFRERLNQTTTREEAVPIFKEAVVELNKYGLLPKGMSVEQTQKLVSGELFPTKILNLLKKILLIQNKNIDIPNDVLNLLCFFYAHTIDAYEINIWVLIASLFGYLRYKYDLKIFSYLNELFYEYGQFKPLKFMNEIDIGVGTAYSYFTMGLLGVQNGSHDFHNAYGFSGIKVTLEYGQIEAVYFGFALKVTKFT
ncbi:MAG: hypothetical protein IMZ43_07150 [Thermoplasmata archaeon]|nr:hypothetical protein [Thermoplasmata archaeon]